MGNVLPKNVKEGFCAEIPKLGNPVPPWWKDPKLIWKGKPNLVFPNPRNFFPLIFQGGIFARHEFPPGGVKTQLKERIKKASPKYRVWMWNFWEPKKPLVSGPQSVPNVELKSLVWIPSDGLRQFSPGIIFRRRIPLVFVKFFWYPEPQSSRFKAFKKPAP